MLSEIFRHSSFWVDGLTFVGPTVCSGNATSCDTQPNVLVTAYKCYCRFSRLLVICLNSCLPLHCCLHTLPEICNLHPSCVCTCGRMPTIARRFRTRDISIAETRKLIWFLFLCCTLPYSPSLLCDRGPGKRELGRSRWPLPLMGAEISILHHLIQLPCGHILEARVDRWLILPYCIWIVQCKCRHKLFRISEFCLEETRWYP